MKIGSAVDNNIMLTNNLRYGQNLGFCGGGGFFIINKY